MGEEEPRKKGDDRKNKYAVACSIIGSIISILMGYGKQNENIVMHVSILSKSMAMT
jgi:hypothetical protein